MSARQAPQPELWVRFVRTEEFQDPSLASRALAVLGATERDALARLRPAAARRDYLAGHALARTMLAELVGEGPEQLRFRSSPNGRPELVDRRGAPRPCFSISHADGIALCAVAMECRVGADVESARNLGPDLLAIVAAICSRREKEMIFATPASQWVERLLSLWTIKEAVAKARGLGFELPPVEITVTEDRCGTLALEFDPDEEDEATLWRLASCRLMPHHVAAVAVRRATAEPIEVRFEEVGSHAVAGVLPSPDSRAGGTLRRRLAPRFIERESA